MSDIRNIALIGSSGFIGRHLTQRLSREKNLRLFLFGRSGDEYSKDNITYRKINFFDSNSLKENFKNIDLVYYLVSETIPASSWQNPIQEIEKNLLPFLSFMEAISTLKVKKVVFISSAGTVYGTTSGKVAENFDKQPFSPYGIMKLTMENFLNYYRVKSQLQYDVYRVSNVYGEGQNTGKGLGIINTFLEKIITDKQIKIFGDGKNTRNYIYVKDVAELLTLSLRTPESSDVYNVSSDSTCNITELVETIRSIIPDDFTTIYEESRQSDNAYIDLDNSKILSRFPNFTFTDLRSGITETYSSLKKQAIKSK